MLPQPGLQPYPGLTNVALDTAAGDLVHIEWITDCFSIARVSLTLVSTEQSDHPDLHMTLKML